MRRKGRAVSKKACATIVGFFLCASILTVVIVTYIALHAGFGDTSGNVVATVAPPLPPTKVRRTFPIDSLLKKVRKFADDHGIIMSATDAEKIAASSYATGKVENVLQEYGEYIAKFVDIKYADREATPEALLDHYLGKKNPQFCTFNEEAESELHNEGYALHPSRSDKFADPMHLIRRGYGMEGSIFVAVDVQPSGTYFLSDALVDAARLAHFGGNATAAFDRTLCATTVGNVFSAARWPAAVSVGIVELVATEKNTGVAGSETQTPVSIPLNIANPTNHPCVPRTFYQYENEETLGFRYKDNIRIKPVLIPLNLSTVSQSARTKLSFSSSAAVRLATMQLYRGESYVMFLQSGNILIPQWDWKLKLLHSQLPERDQAVISTRATPSHLAIMRGLIMTAVRPYVTGSILPRPREQAGDTTPFERSAAELFILIASDPYSAIHLALPSWVHGLLTETLNEIPFTMHVMANNVWDLSVTEVAGGKAGSLSYTELVDYIYSVDHGVEQVSEDAPAQIEFFSRSECRDWFSAKNRSLNKRIYEKCWVLLHRKAIQAGVKREMLHLNQTTILFLEPDNSDGFRIVEEILSATTDCMRDMRFFELYQNTRAELQITHASAVKRGNPSAAQRPSGIPFFLQGVASSELLFGRAETFVPIPTGLQLRTSPHEESVPLTNIRFDPFMTFLTRDESDLLLSAKLWTLGWNIFAPTEPLAFALAAAAPSVTTTTTTMTAGNSSSSTIPEHLLKLRTSTITRLKRVLRAGESGKDGALGKGELYGLGSARTLKDYEAFAGIDMQKALIYRK